MRAIAIFSISIAALFGCDDSSTAASTVNGAPAQEQAPAESYYCEFNGQTYSSVTVYQNFCNPSLYPDEPVSSSSVQSSSSVKQVYCCERRPSECYESKWERDGVCGDKPPSSNLEKCSKNSCYQALSHTAAGSSAGPSYMSSMCHCSLD